MNDGAGLVHKSTVLSAPVLVREVSCAADIGASTEAPCFNALTPGTFFEPKCPPTIGGVEGGKMGIPVKGGTILRERIPSCYLNKGKYEKLALLLFIIIDRSVQREDGWVPICSGFLNEVFNDEARRYLLEVLREAGAIEREDWRFTHSGRRSARCRLTEEYSKLPFEWVGIPFSQWFRYVNHEIERRDRTIGSHPVLGGLWDDLQCLSLDPAYEAVMPIFGEEEWRRECAWYRSIGRIQRKDFGFSCVPGMGRVYTTFSSTPSILRRYALLDDKPVVSIDVCSCQPFLHGTLIPTGGEKDRYMVSVLSGHFYEDIGRAGGCGEGMDKGELKRAVFSEVFYGRTRPDVTAPIWGAFKELYPSLAEAITAKKRENYRRLAVEMQDLEAQIIIYDAIPAMRSAVPGLKVLTVHDAIYLPSEYAQLAEEKLAQAFVRRTGYAPALKIEPSAIGTSMCSAIIS